jgi:hypothetical protein
MSNGAFIAGAYPAKRQVNEETIHMKAIVVTDQAAGLETIATIQKAIATFAVFIIEPGPHVDFIPRD